MANCFLPAEILLPPAGTPLDPWACIAVDQFTSEPAYWQRAEARAAHQPSTLHIVLPEAYLGTPEEPARLAEIRATMQAYHESLLTRRVHGYVYVERTLQDGLVRQGLVGMVDLEAYSYTPGEKPAIRPSEQTVVARIPPRLAVRRGALLETPHVMMLADDRDDTLIGPVARSKAALPLLYEGELMLGGGHLAGWAVEEPDLIAGIDAALAALGDPEAFAARWPAAAGQPPMVLAVGDGNHSLATAKAYWEECKAALPLAAQATHPARYCLAEVCNVHSPAIEIEPIHRVVFGASAAETAAAFAAWGARNGVEKAADAAPAQTFTVADAAGETVVALAASPDPLTVGTVEHFLTDWLSERRDLQLDYIHGAASARALAADPARPAAALLLPPFEKSDLFRGVVPGGVLPRNTFRMGHAEEKRYYNECRSLAGGLPEEE